MYMQTKIVDGWEFVVQREHDDSSDIREDPDYDGLLRTSRYRHADQAGHKRCWEIVVHEERYSTVYLDWRELVKRARKTWGAPDPVDAAKKAVVRLRKWYRGDIWYEYVSAKLETHWEELEDTEISEALKEWADREGDLNRSCGGLENGDEDIVEDACLFAPQLRVW
jgi:hypothetical protein